MIWYDMISYIEFHWMPLQPAARVDLVWAWRRLADMQRPRHLPLHVSYIADMICWYSWCATPSPSSSTCNVNNIHSVSFLATLVALHFTLVSESLPGWAEFRTSGASRLASLYYFYLHILNFAGGWNSSLICLSSVAWQWSTLHWWALLMRKANNFKLNSFSPNLASKIIFGIIYFIFDRWNIICLSPWTTEAK